MMMSQKSLQTLTKEQPRRLISSKYYENSDFEKTMQPLKTFEIDVKEEFENHRLLKSKIKVLNELELDLDMNLDFLRFSSESGIEPTIISSEKEYNLFLEVRGSLHELIKNAHRANLHRFDALEVGIHMKNLFSLSRSIIRTLSKNNLLHFCFMVEEMVKMFTLLMDCFIRHSYAKTEALKPLEKNDVDEAHFVSKEQLDYQIKVNQALKDSN